MEKKGLFPMRCAVFRHEDGRHRREMPRLSTTKTVVMAIKTVTAAMKTVFMPVKAFIPFFNIQVHPHFGLLQPILREFSISIVSGCTAFQRQKDCTLLFPARLVFSIVN